MTFQKSGKEQKKKKKERKRKRKEKKILEHLNSIHFKQQRPILGEEEEAAHMTYYKERAVPAKVVPCFLFSLHILQWKVLLLSTGWLTLMRNIPLYKTLCFFFFVFFLQTELCVPLTCFQIRFKKGDPAVEEGPRPFGITTNMIHTDTHTRACPSHSYILTHSALIPYPFPLQTV